MFNIKHTIDSIKKMSISKSKIFQVYMILIIIKLLNNINQVKLAKFINLNFYINFCFSKRYKNKNFKINFKGEYILYTKTK